jgi:nitrous oxide reductase accessory protein NosL
MDTPPEQIVTRRRALQTAGVGTVLGLAGCLGVLGSDSDAPDPVDLSGGKSDYQGGMEIGRHGGPNGQIFYADNQPESPHASGDSPEARADLAWFHTLVHGLFPYHFDRTNRGWEAEVIYVTDYSAVDWELQDGDRMPAPTAPETFADATGLTYVAESDARGGMGPELFPFSDAGEAETFVQEHGGQTLDFGDIDSVTVRDLMQG